MKAREARGGGTPCGDKRKVGSLRNVGGVVKRAGV